MFTHRTSVLALAAIATLALAASTDAEASPFCHRGGFASFSRAYFPAAPQQRIVSAKPRFDAARTAKKYVPEAVVTKTARAHPKNVETPAEPANSYQPAQLAGAAPSRRFPRRQLPQPRRALPRNISIPAPCCSRTFAPRNGR